MMRLPKFDYRAARTVAEALEWMGEFDSGADKDPSARAMFMAGGTDVLPNMKHRIFSPHIVVGLRGISALRGIAYDPDHGLRIGAGVALSEVASSSIVRDHYPALAQAAEAVSTPQLRQMGTLGGNLCLDTRCNYYNQSEFWRSARDYCLKKGSDICRVAPNGTGCYAVSSCDTAPALIVFGATARVASRRGDRITPVAELYHDDGIHPVRLHEDEVLTDVYLPPLAQGWRSAYVKYRVRGSFDFPIVGVAATADFEDEHCVEVHLVLQAVATHPLPLPEAEGLLRGRHWTAELLDSAADIAYHSAHPMDNTAGTIALRRRMVKAHTRRALELLLPATGR